MGGRGGKMFDYTVHAYHGALPQTNFGNTFLAPAVKMVFW